MNSLQRMMAAVRGEPFDAYPFTNPYPTWSLMPHWKELTGLTFVHDWFGSDEQRLAGLRAMNQIIGLDALPAPGGPTGQDTRYRIDEAPADPAFEPGPGEKKLDKAIVVMELRTNKTMRLDAYPIDSPVERPAYGTAAQVKSLPAPPTASQLLESGQFGMAKLAAETVGRDVFLFHATMGPFAGCYYTLGFNALYEALLFDESLLFALLEYRTEQLIQEARAMAAIGVQGMRVNDFFCSAEMISEEHYLKYAFPYEQRLFRAMKEAGLVTILEMLGWVEPRLPHIARLEVDCFQSESGLKGYRNDVAEFRRVLGEGVCLWGNSLIRQVIEEGDEAAWRADAADQARGIGRQRRYAICAGSPTTWNTGPRRLHDYGAFTRAALADLAPPLR